jgi:hypothetical protein
MTLAQIWLTECVENHSECRRTQEIPYFPTRLIDVTEGESSDWRLYIPSEDSTMEVPLSYMTLSHCWGKLEFLRLLSNNIDTLKAGMRLSDLTKTFRDAVTVVRRLGQRYIWIDSLCIIQDSVDDWRAECGRMTDVYANSWCNIAATAACNGNEGCFQDRDPTTLELCSVTSEWTDYENRTFYLHDTGLWDEGVTYAPLNLRAWVLQERLLSPRILHFGRDQLYWQCRQAACETYPNGTYNYESRSKDFLGLHEPVTLFKSGLRIEFPVREGPFHIWWAAASQYMRCGLTNPADKLVAISGVAKHLQRTLVDDEYLAGLWKSRLLFQLCWCLHPQTIRTEAPDYRAPSWSWASVEGILRQFDTGPAEINHSDIMPLAEVIDAKVVSATDDSTGQLVDGHLVLKSQLVPAELWELGSERSIMVIGEKRVSAAIFPDLQVEPGKTFCLPLFVVDNFRHTTHMLMFGLIVNSTKNKEDDPDEYVRYGMFKASLGWEGVCDAFGIEIEPEEPGARPLPRTELHYNVEKVDIVLV